MSRAAGAAAAVVSRLHITSPKQQVQGGENRQGIEIDMAVHSPGVCHREIRKDKMRSIVNLHCFVVLRYYFLSRTYKSRHDYRVVLLHVHLDIARGSSPV